MVPYNTQRQTDKERLFMYILISIIIIQSLLIAIILKRAFYKSNQDKFWKDECIKVLQSK